MRKSWNSLAALTEGPMKQDPFSEAIFVFCGRTRHLLKILYWDGNGFCIWQKRLEQGTFPWPATAEEVQELDRRQFHWLLSGVDFRRAHRLVHFSRAT